MTDPFMTVRGVFTLLHKMWKLTLVVFAAAWLVEGILITGQYFGGAAENGLLDDFVKIVGCVGSFLTAIVAIAWVREQWFYDKECKRVEQFNSLLQMYRTANALESIKRGDMSGFGCLSHVAYDL